MRLASSRRKTRAWVSFALDVLDFALAPGISDVERQGENHDQGCELQGADQACTKKLP